MSTSARTFAVTVVLLAAVSGCASTAPQHSGFIRNEPAMQEEKDTEGTVQRYVSPKLSSGAYKKVLVEPVQLYPEPQPSDKVDAATLRQVRDYMDQALRRELGKRVGLAVAVREGTGEKVKGGGQDKVTLQTVQPCRGRSAVGQRFPMRVAPKRFSCPAGWQRQYWRGALTWPPSLAAACQGQRGS